MQGLWRSRRWWDLNLSSVLESALTADPCGPLSISGNAALTTSSPAQKPSVAERIKEVLGPEPGRKHHFDLITQLSDLLVPSPCVLFLALLKTL